MKLFEIFTHIDLQLEDGSYEDVTETMVLSEEEYKEDSIKKIIESVYGDFGEISSFNIREIAAEEFSKCSEERIINDIVKGIYIENLRLPKTISIREYANVCNDKMHHALALKQFEEKYSIYRTLLNHLDLNKVSVAELFERVEKLYAARLTDEYLTVFNEAIK